VLSHSKFCQPYTRISIGSDATEAFEDVGHSDEARELLPGMFVGDFDKAGSVRTPLLNPIPIYLSRPIQFISSTQILILIHLQDIKLFDSKKDLQAGSVNTAVQQGSKYVPPTSPDPSGKLTETTLPL
jgi:hypothetical protein